MSDGFDKEGEEWNDEFFEHFQGGASERRFQ
jgi:hypothetical protein